MNKRLSKRLIWLVLLLMAPVLILAALGMLGRIVEHAGSGADRESALNIVPALPSDLPERLVWLPDAPDAAHDLGMQRYTRDQVARAYLHAWAQLNVSRAIGKPYGLSTYFADPIMDSVSAPIVGAAADDWRIEQADIRHVLEVTFVSADKSVVAFRDHDVRLVQHFVHEESGIEYVQENDSVYDVVMFLEDGNWRIRSWRRIGDAAEMSDMPSTAPETGQQQTFYAGETDRSHAASIELPQNIVGLNYYPQSSPWTKFWPEYDSDQTQVDLQRMAELGINAVRIFVPFSDFTDDELGAEHIENLKDFLDQARSHNIGVIVTLFDHRTDHNVGNWPADDRFIGAVIPALSEHPGILAWDLKNEPDRDYDYNGAPLVQEWLRHIAREIRRYDQVHPLTIGWSSPESARALADTVDFVSYHYFDDPDDYEVRVRALQEAIPDKQLLLQEFAVSTWNSLFPGGHSELEQASYYAELLTAHRSFESAGYMAWTLYDFDSIPLPEFRFPWQKRQQAHMGIVRGDGTLKPAARLLHPDSPLTVTEAPWWHAITKPFRLLVAAVFLFAVLALLGIMYRYAR